MKTVCRLVILQTNVHQYLEYFNPITTNRLFDSSKKNMFYSFFEIIYQSVTLLANSMGYGCYFLNCSVSVLCMLYVLYSNNDRKRSQIT